MFDLPDCLTLDKATLIGTCARLPVAIDAARLHIEVNALPREYWGTSGGRVGVHRAADAVFLRGHAPAAGDLPIEDRPALSLLPYARTLIYALGQRPLRCLLARLPPGEAIAPHVDSAPYFEKTVRIHVAVETSEQAWMVCGGLSFRMRPGEAWALNNGALHAVWNAHPRAARTHLICDFVPTPPLLALLQRSERDLGQVMAEVDEHLAGLARAAAPGT